MSMFSKGIQAALKSGSKSSDELFDQVDKMLKEGKSPEKPEIPTLYRGLDNKEIKNKLEPRSGYNVFASTNPDVAAGYSGVEGEVIPFKADADKIIEFTQDPPPSARVPFNKFEFDRRAKLLGKGEVLVARNVVDAGPRGDISTGLNYTALSDIYAIGEGTPLRQITPKQEFKKTRKAYKLFVKKDDKLYPLFVNAADEVPQGEFLEADFPDTAFKGKTLGGTEGFYVPTKGAKREKGEKVKKTGDTIIIPDEETRQKLIETGFITKRAGRTEDAPYGKVTAVAARPGWHSSVNPVAEHLGPQDLKITKTEAKKLIQAGINPKAIRTRGDQYYVKRRAEDHVWAEVDMADDTSDELLEYMAQTGRTDINDKVPVGGSYSYVDGQADGDTWIVGGNMRVNRTLTREEARALQDELGVKDLPYRDEVEAILGRKFAEGGLVGEQNMYKGEQDYLTTASSGADMNQGGTPMMEQQMSFFNEGGLKDEGGEVDPVSGNDVPIGSTKKEVRDDIPAMVSEGEFVFPADVVRYIGLEKLMQLRQDAKMGLKQMEAMGQMGNSEEATIPDDMPFDMADIVIVEGADEPKEMAQGGVIQAQTGTFVTPIFDPEDKDMRPYTNDGGKTVRYIPFLNNSPVYPIPSGYVPLDQATATPEETPEEVAPTEDGGGGGRDREPFRSEFQKAGGWDMDFGDPPDPKKVELWIKEAEKVSTVGNIATGIVSAINPVVGIATHLGTKLNKKGILDNAEIVRGIASEDQIERINNVTERLTDSKRKGILSKALNGVIDGLSNIFKSEEEKNAAKVQTGNSAGTNPYISDEELKQRHSIAESMLERTVNSQNVNRITNLLATTPNVDSTLAGDIDKAVSLTDTDDADAMNLIDEEPVPYVDESAMNMLDESTSRSMLSPTEQAIEDAKKRIPPDIDTLSPTEKAIEDARNKEKIIIDPSDTSQMLEPPQQFENTAGQMQALQYEKDKTPLGVQQIARGVEDFRNLAGIVGQKLAPTETGSSQLYQDLASGLQTSRAAELYDNLTSSIFSTFESTSRGRGRTDEVVKAPEGLSTAYQAGQQRRGSTTKTKTTEPKGETTEELREKLTKERKKKRRETTRDILQKSRDIQKEKEKTGKSIAEIARERAPSSAAKSAAEKAKEEGDPRNMKSGGLASRKKKK